MTGKARERRALELNQPPASVTESALVSEDISPQDVPMITKYDGGNPSTYVDAFTAILRAYPTPVTTLRVEILRAHGSLFKGSTIEVPNDDHTAAMIQGGFYMVVPPTLLGVDWT